MIYIRRREEEEEEKEEEEEEEEEDVLYLIPCLKSESGIVKCKEIMVGNQFV